MSCVSVCVCVLRHRRSIRSVVRRPSYNFSTISYFLRKSTASFFGSNFFLAASFARNSATVIFRFSPEDALDVGDDLVGALAICGAAGAISGGSCCCCGAGTLLLMMLVLVLVIADTVELLLTWLLMVVVVVVLLVNVC